jgi:NADH dehydrogenase [ubiquinone] 1 alpha subcomplex assembly factor 1
MSLTPLFAFSTAAEAAAWRPIDDVVMGGVSQSRLEFVSAGRARFTGIVSLDRGGGFASVRNATVTWDLRHARGLRLRVCGDGKRYKLILLDRPVFDGVQHQASLHPPADILSEVDLPFLGFVPRFRGRDLPGADRLNPAGICGIGLMISEGQAGAFSLELERISVYSGSAESPSLSNNS